MHGAGKTDKLSESPAILGINSFYIDCPFATWSLEFYSLKRSNNEHTHTTDFQAHTLRSLDYGFNMIQSIQFSSTSLHIRCFCSVFSCSDHRIILKFAVAASCLVTWPWPQICHDGVQYKSSPSTAKPHSHEMNQNRWCTPFSPRMHSYPEGFGGTPLALSRTFVV